MIRMFWAAVAVLAVCAGGVLAEEMKGTLKSFNKDKNVITVAIDGKDKEFKVNDKTKVLRGDKEAPNGLEMVGKLMERLKDKGLPVKIDVDGDTVKSISLGLNASGIQPGNVPAQNLKPNQVNPIQLKPIVRPLPAPAPNGIAPQVKPVQQ